MTEGFGALVAAMSPVSLEHINDVAALQTRVDRKYVVSLEMLDRLHLGDDAAVLAIAGRRQFGYATTYFDTPARDLYMDTAHRRPRRFKVRIRAYVESDLVMLEVKRKDGRGKTVKLRHEMDVGASRNTLTAEMCAFVDDAVDTTLTPRLVEAVTTSFRRTTIIDETCDARYTVDHDLVAAAPDGRTVPLVGAVVVECKSTGGSTPLDRMLWSHGVRPEPMSKYCTALAMLEPSLPANHWHRTLRRHFGGRVDAA